MPFFAALIPAAISGAAALGSALIGKSTADKNAAAQTATNSRINELGAPYRAAGTNALADMQTAYGQGDPNTLGGRQSQMMANFKNSPLYQMSYQPAVDQAMLEEQRMGSSRGDLNGGRTLMAIQDRAARLGGQTFGNYLSGITHMADQGQSAAFGTAGQMQAGQNALSSYSNDAGNALGAGIMGAGSAIGSGIGSYYQKQGQNALSSYGSSSNPVIPQAQSYYLPPPRQ